MPNLPVFICDIRAVHTRMSEIKNGRLGLYGAEHSKCNRVLTLRFKRHYANIFQRKFCKRLLTKLALLRTTESVMGKVPDDGIK